MPESRMMEVAQELLSQSKDHKVDWEDAGREDHYRVFFPDVVLAVSRTGSYAEEFAEFLLELISDAGRVIDFLETTPQDSLYPLLNQIFDLAEEYVRDTGIDKALEYLKQA